nr:hypothetical protein [Tanacetum cinerariifolium]
MVLPNNQVSSPESVLDNKALEDSSNDSNFDADLYNEEDNVNNVVILQTPSEEVRTRIYYIRIHPSLIRGIDEVRIWDNIENPPSLNYTRRSYSICFENTINMINSIKDLKEENRDIPSSIYKAIKLMLAIATNMSCVVENDIKKEESKDNLNEEQISDDGDSQGGSDEEVDEEEAKEFYLLAKNFRMFFRNGNRFGRDNGFGNEANRFGKGRGNSFGTKVVKDQSQRGIATIAV